MPTINCLRYIPIERTPRVMQLEGLFDVSPANQSEVCWSAHLPFEEHDWDIGLIVGPSGCGKTTLAKELFGDRIVQCYDWPPHQSVVDGFPGKLGIREITALLSKVGFSSPPAWVRPFRTLSNGEQFRATLARSLAASTGTVVIDFDAPRTAALSPRDWADRYQSRANVRNVLVDLLGSKGSAVPMPRKTGVKWTIRPSR